MQATIVPNMVIDATDATFETDVLARSDARPVVIDLWAPWCGPCKTLGPIIESVIAEKAGEVELVKINIDENPGAARAFNVQSIPAVFAMKDRKVIDGFVGALGEQAVREFVNRLIVLPSEADELVAKGDENSLRAALSLEPDHSGAILALATVLLDDHKSEEALELLARIPETTETRHLAARARLDARGEDLSTALADGSIEERLNALLDRVKTDDSARQEYLDILESLDVTDPRREQFRRTLSSRLF